MIDIVNFSIVFFISVFAFFAGFYGVFLEIKKGYITKEDFIIGFSFMILGGYGIFILFKYIFPVG